MKDSRSYRSSRQPSLRTGYCSACSHKEGKAAFGSNKAGRACTLEASFTVEASLLMMILIPLLLTSLFMSEYLCDRTRAQAVLAEEAVVLAAGEDGSVSGPAGFFFLKIGERTVENGGTAVTGRLVSAEKTGILHIETEISVMLTKRRPVRLIRKLEAVKALIAK